jgi:GWxTD domain-containing protein
MLAAGQEKTGTGNSAQLQTEADTAQNGWHCFQPRVGATIQEQLRDAMTRLSANHRFWLTEDAAYIITSEERCAFLMLPSSIDRDLFIEQFWLRRSPDPDSLANPFEEEHYRRIMFANEHFDTGSPGWKSHRGRIYIQCGPSDQIIAHSIGDPDWGAPDNALDSGRYSWERWHYRYIEGLGENIDLDFVDRFGSGNFQLLLLPPDNDLALYQPHLDGQPALSEWEREDVIQRFVLYIGPARTPSIHHKDLQALLTSRIARNQVDFSYQVQAARVTHASTMMTLTIDITKDKPLLPGQNPAESYQMFGRITRSDGRIVDTFEESGAMQKFSPDGKIFSAVEIIGPLNPGSYGLAIAIKEIETGRIGVQYTSLVVPRYDDIVPDPPKPLLY